MAGFDAVILAGGRGSRLGGADKPGLVVAGTTTMAAAVTRAAAAAGARRVVLVGPPRPEIAEVTASLPDGLIVAREDPPGSGPVPALRAGLAAVTAPWVALLAADLPFLRPVDLRDLLAAASASEPGRSGAVLAGGAVLADDDGVPQWLAGCWRTSQLRAALAAYGGASLRGVLGPLSPVLLRPAAAGGGPPPWLDCDTPAELEAARAAAARSGRPVIHPAIHPRPRIR